ncbi:hypothetical protein RJ640_005489 [Escallonia rubra]|uniref:non-specific serine/threonine protein kinase n=1 Tax=Escallonia rubra TaxID=112253 RepID=A0AA88UVK3_9ASTE|nr:hypothetical protein RJ640_005489 [Escallonia rubra]
MEQAVQNYKRCCSGVLYLHENSRIRIVHCDLKASNCLLDEEMNLKIANFGMARLFELDETQGRHKQNCWNLVIKRALYNCSGYMSPKYARHGHFSVNSDVFTFGVLVLEVASDQKNNCFRSGSSIESSFRPTMASVIQMLNSFSITRPVPLEPTFFMHSSIDPEFSLCKYNSGSNDSNQSTSKYDQGPEVFDVDDGAVEHVAEAVEVAHADLAEVARMVFVEEDAVMVHTTGVSPPVGMLQIEDERLN